MYVKPSNRQIRGMYVPENYNGTTFTDPAPEQDTPEVSLQAPSEPQTATLPEAVPAAKTQKNAAQAGLFSGLGLGGLRSDDLLLLALIVLMSRTDGQGQQSCSEILPLLTLLLFLG